MKAKLNWVRRPSAKMATYGITKQNLNACVNRLCRETGESFELLNRCEGGFCVRDETGNDGFRQIRIIAEPYGTEFIDGDGHYPYGTEFRLMAQGGHNKASVPWTQEHVKFLYAIIAEEISTDEICPYRHSSMKDVIEMLIPTNDAWREVVINNYLDHPPDLARDYLDLMHDDRIPYVYDDRKNAQFVRKMLDRLRYHQAKLNHATETGDASVQTSA